MRIQKLIKKEKKYFAKILEKHKNISEKKKENWRHETVFERKMRLSLEVFEIMRGKVKFGPFKGLKLSKNCAWGKLDLGSQCLGLYEKQLLSEIEKIKPKEFSNFINIGAADGYYAIGMLMSKKIQRALCFEKSIKGRNSIIENWKLNNCVGKLEIQNKADEKNLLKLPKRFLDKALIIIDIEGDEFDILSKNVLETIRNTTIIIEIHNWVEDFLFKYQTLLETANNFFNIQIIKNTSRNTYNSNKLREFTDDNRLLISSEHRPCLMRFLKFSPK
mgnify:CR=1 FL=1